MRRGFTLIEMSVVLVIIGLLTGGIIIAQTLVRSSRIQTIVTDVSTYQNAISQFRQKYNALPGDMLNATTYWGTNPNCSTGGAGTGTQTCNGNGNGTIDIDVTAPYEQFLAWQHMVNGGFLTGIYTGGIYAGATGAYYYCSPGYNCPMGQVDQAQTYLLGYKVGPIGGNTTNYWDSPGVTNLVIGNAFTPYLGFFPGVALLTVPEAYALDKKIDDGLPGQGVWKTFSPNGSSYKTGGCVVNGSGAALADGTMASATTAVYNTTYSNKLPACAFLVRMSF